MPRDSRIDQKEVKKISKYQDLAVSQNRRIVRKEGSSSSARGDRSLGIQYPCRDLMRHLKTFGVEKISPSKFQKVALGLLGTVHICENISKIFMSSERTRTTNYSGPKTPVQDIWWTLE